MACPNALEPRPDAQTFDHTTEESTPLLQTIRSQKSEKLPAHASYVLLLVCSLLVLIDFGGYLGFAPQTAIFEKIICDNYYGRDGREEVHSYYLQSAQDPCKIKPIQGELAVINGWKDMFDQIPGILLAMPYGVIADRIGRRPVLLLGMSGLILSDVWIKLVTWFPSVFHLRLVWLSSLSQVIGGGALVGTSMFFVILTDVFEPANRANGYFKLSASVLISEIAAAPLSGALMMKNPWIPYLMSTAIYIVSLLMIFALPETMPHLKKADDINGDENVSGLCNPASSSSSVWNQLKHRIRDARSANFSCLRPSMANYKIFLLLYTFCVTSLGRQSMFLLLQYVSKRYEWSFATASFLMPVRAVTNLLVLLVILPFITAYLLRRLRFSAATKDILILRASGVLLTVGSLAIGLAWTPALLIVGLIVVALGSAFHLVARSLAAALVPAAERGVLFTTIAVITGAGSFVAGPLLASTFKRGMDIGGWAYGLPFVLAGLLYLSATVGAFLVRVTDKTHEDEDSGSIEG